MRVLAGFVLLLAAGLASAVCPPGDNEPLSVLRRNIDLAIVRIDTNGPGDCTGTGTGFFVNRSGRILTAGHVVPEECDATSTILVRWETQPGGSTLSEPVKATVVQRSSLDLAVLELADAPRGTQYLKVGAALSAAQSQALQNTCILLASHYFEQANSYTSYAEIASTSLIDDARWALAGDGFNASRSGSPIVTADGVAIAIFLARPDVDPKDRRSTTENRAYVYPLGAIPQTEVDVQALGAIDANLKAFYTSPGTAIIQIPQRLQTAFGFSITETGFKTDPALPTFVVDSNGNLSETQSLADAALRVLLNSGSVVRRVGIQRTFSSSPGYAFDPTSIRFAVASHNPTQAPLPAQDCEKSERGGCYLFRNGNRTVELHIDMFPGFDGRNAWLDAEMLIAQIRQ